MGFIFSWRVEIILGQRDLSLSLKCDKSEDEKFNPGEDLV